jgi:acid phosphatase (class A)
MHKLNLLAGLPVALLLVVVGLPSRRALAAPSGSDCLIASADVPEIHKGLLKGYLPDNAMPDSLQLLPPPPQLGQPEHALDDTVSRRSFPLPGTPRWNLAAADADLRFPQAASTFSCAIGAPISEEATPTLVMLLRRTLTDAGLSTYKAKNHYGRKRPFLVNGKPICSPEDQAKLTTDPSYPSGHTAVGWAWALILSEMVPQRRNEILARGLAYGESRHLCNVHWASDVMNGQLMGAAAVALLHTNAEFEADFIAAKAEVNAAKAKGLPPSRDCAAEAAALAQRTRP